MTFDTHLEHDVDAGPAIFDLIRRAVNHLRPEFAPHGARSGRSEVRLVRGERPHRELVALGIDFLRGK